MNGMLELFKVGASLILDKSGFDSDIREADAAGKGLSESLSKHMEKAKKVIKGLFSVGAVVAATKAIWNLAKETSAAGDRIDKQSQALGLSRKAYQEWDYILRQSGASIDDMGMAMKTMSAAILENSADTAAGLSKLGLSAAQLSNMSPEEQLETLVKAFQEMPEGAEKSRLAMQLFGRNAQSLMPLLNSASGSVDELRNRAHSLGLIMSDEDVDSAVAFGDALDDLNAVWTALKQKFGAQLLPGLTKGLVTLANALGRITNSLTEAFKTGDWKGVFATITEEIGNLLPQAIDALVGIITGLFENVDEIVDLGISIIDGITDGITKAAPTLIAKLPGILSKMWESFKSAGLKMGNLLIDAINSIFGTNIPHLEVILEWVQKAWDDVSSAFATAAEWVGNAWNTTVNWIQTAWKDVSDAFTTAGEWIGSVWDTTVNWVQTAWQDVSDAFAAAGKWIGETWDTTVNWVQTAWDDVSNAFDAAGKWIGSIWNTTVNWVQTAWDDVSNAFDAAGKWVGSIWDTTVNWVQTAWDDVSNAFDAAGKWIGETWNTTVNWVQTAWKDVSDAFDTAGKWIGSIWDTTVNWIKTGWDDVSSAFETAGGWIGSIWDTTVNWVKTGWDDIQNAFTTVGNWVSTGASVAIDFLSNTIGGWIKTIAGWLGINFDGDESGSTGSPKVTLSFLDGDIPEWIKRIYDWVTNGVRIVVDFFNGGNSGNSEWEGWETEGPPDGWDGTYSFSDGKLQYNAKGLNYVPYDGYRTVLHRGEAVLNASQGREWRQNGGGAGIDFEALAAAVSGAVAEAVSNISLNMDGKLVGSAVAGQVSREITRSLMGRRVPAL